MKFLFIRNPYAFGNVATAELRYLVGELLKNAMKCVKKKDSVNGYAYIEQLFGVIRLAHLQEIINDDEFSKLMNYRHILRKRL